jgi:hypothetical protein
MRFSKALAVVLLLACAVPLRAAQIADGVTGSQLLGVDPNTKALRASPRPIDPGALGAYCISQVTGTMAAGLAAESQVLQFRWTDASRFAAITKVQFDGGGNTGTAFAAGFYRFSAYVVRSFSASGTGGTAATITGGNQKLRTSFGTTLLGETRVATTAALGAVTTLDTQAIGAATGGLPATAGQAMPGFSMYDAAAGQAHPVVLAQNEGIAIKATVPATGTWTASWTICWTELTAY